MSCWQFRSIRLAVVKVHLFLLVVERIILVFVCDFREQHTYSAAIETLLYCKHLTVDLNAYLVKQFYGNKHNITFVSMTDDDYDTRA